MRRSASIKTRIGKPPAEASPTDPRERIDRALTYYEYHRSRMNYPEYRRLGLPLTSSHIESTIKQINRRVKGSEKFWLAIDQRSGPATASRLPQRLRPARFLLAPPPSPPNRGQRLRPGHLKLTKCGMHPAALSVEVAPPSRAQVDVSSPFSWAMMSNRLSLGIRQTNAEDASAAFPCRFLRSSSHAYIMALKIFLSNAVFRFTKDILWL